MTRLGSPCVLLRLHAVVLALLASSTAALENILTHAQLSDLVSGSGALPVLVYYRHATCGPCKVIDPEIADLARVYAGSVVLAQVDVKQNFETAKAEFVQSVPSLHVFRRGEFERKLVSADDRSRTEFLSSLRALLRDLAPEVAESNSDSFEQEQELFSPDEFEQELFSPDESVNSSAFEQMGS